MTTPKQIEDGLTLEESVNNKTVREIRKAISDAKLLISDTLNNLETEYGVNLYDLDVAKKGSGSDFFVSFSASVKQK